jgi:hypothetical protein
MEDDEAEQRRLQSENDLLRSVLSQIAAPGGRATPKQGKKTSPKRQAPPGAHAGPAAAHAPMMAASRMGMHARSPSPSDEGEGEDDDDGDGFDDDDDPLSLDDEDLSSAALDEDEAGEEQQEEEEEDDAFGLLNILASACMAHACMGPQCGSPDTQPAAVTLPSSPIQSCPPSLSAA